MNPFLEAVFSTGNVALILAVAGCIVCGLFHMITRKEDRADRALRDRQAQEERAMLYVLISRNTDAMHEIKNVLSEIKGKVN